MGFASPATRVSLYPSYRAYLAAVKKLIEDKRGDKLDMLPYEVSVLFDKPIQDLGEIYDELVNLDDELLEGEEILEALAAVKLRRAH